jgi:hypothetical protein
LQLKKPLSPRYFCLRRLQHMLSSPPSILKIYLASRHLFITLVFVKPNPPALLGDAKSSHLAIWYFLLKLGPCQKEIDQADSIFWWISSCNK